HWIGEVRVQHAEAGAVVENALTERGNTCTGIAAPTRCRRRVDHADTRAVARPADARGHAAYDAVIDPEGDLAALDSHARHRLRIIDGVCLLAERVQPLSDERQVITGRGAQQPGRRSWWRLNAVEAVDALREAGSRRG